MFSPNALEIRGKGDSELNIAPAQNSFPAEARLDSALQAGRLGYWEFDATRRMTGSAQHNRNFGRGDDEPLTYVDFLDAMHPHDRTRCERVLDAALAGGEPIETEVRVNWPDSSQHWLRIGGHRIADEPNRAPRVVGISFDITDHKAMERQQRLLMDELNHRVRNTLAIVLAIANQTLRHANSAAQFRSDFEARVTALSAAHNLLTASNWEGAELRDIAESVLKPYAQSGREAYRLDGEAIRVGPKYSVSLLMAFHELATNAAKYGALSNDNGHVALSWSMTRPPRAPALCIDWREIGGPPVKPRRRRGFGMRLIEGLSAETSGNVNLKFERDGIVCIIEVPLPPNGEGISRVP
jgi:two-component sensor histidine kinase